MRFRIISQLFFVIIAVCSSKLIDEKAKFCAKFQCEDIKNEVCGIREEGAGFKLRLFDSECELMKYGCQVENKKAFGIINLEYCYVKENTTKINPEIKDLEKDPFKQEKENSCKQNVCTNTDNEKEVCGIRHDGTGLKVRLFRNKCRLVYYNCKRKLDFKVTKYKFCNGVEHFEETYNETNNNERFNKDQTSLNKLNNLIVVDGSFIDFNNINESINNFFEATHVLDVPMEEVKRDVLNETSRRMLLKIAGPVKVFKPWITIPKNISEDYYHTPTLSSCYHKCPTKCPDTYAPVCGVPGIVAREPSLMFKNHCFMDVAQCKMFWENKSPTALSSSYIESSFLFCLGDELNGLYRFLPLIRTLQHMGRLKKKGHFRYKMKNLRFFNNLLSREPKLMG